MLYKFAACVECTCSVFQNDERTGHCMVWNSMKAVSALVTALSTLKTESCHDANFVVTRQHRRLSLCRHWRQTLYDDNCQFSSLCQLFGTDGTAGCHKDNHRCHRWRKSWHYDNCQISVGESIDCCPQRFSCLRLWCFVSSAVEQSADQPVDWSLNLDQLPLTWRIEKG